MLSLRGTRHNQPCQLCRQATDIYPMGFWHSPICETCVRTCSITPADLYADSPALLDLYKQETRTAENVHQISAHIVHSHFLSGTGRGGEESPTDGDIRDALRSYFQTTVPTDDCVCRACGTGDNTVGHWSRWCIVPIIVVCHLLKLPHIPSCPIIKLQEIMIEALPSVRWFLHNLEGCCVRKGLSFIRMLARPSPLHGGLMNSWWRLPGKRTCSFDSKDTCRLRRGHARWIIRISVLHAFYLFHSTHCIKPPCKLLSNRLLIKITPSRAWTLTVTLQLP